jgi:hypothetical protein
VQHKENEERDKLDHHAVLDALIEFPAGVEQQAARHNLVSQATEDGAGDSQDGRGDTGKKAGRQDQARGIIIEC